VGEVEKRHRGRLGVRVAAESACLKLSSHSGGRREGENPVGLRDTGPAQINGHEVGQSAVCNERIFETVADILWKEQFNSCSD